MKVGEAVVALCTKGFAPSCVSGLIEDLECSYEDKCTHTTASKSCGSLGTNLVSVH